MMYRQLGPGLVQQMHTVCPKCSGNGSVIPEKDRCKSCDGKKIIVETKEVEIHVDKGMSDGTKITLSGMGDTEVSSLKNSFYWGGFVGVVMSCDPYLISSRHLVSNQEILFTLFSRNRIQSLSEVA